MRRWAVLAIMFLAVAATARAAEPPSVAEWLAMTPQQRMALREETRGWSPAERTRFWARFEDEMKAMTPAERRQLQDQAAREMGAGAPAVPPPEPDPPAKLPKAIALPPPGDLTGRPD